MLGQELEKSCKIEWKMWFVKSSSSGLKGRLEKKMKGQK